MSGAERRLLAREWFLSAVVAAALAGVLLWLGPPGVDLAAHAYQRTFLLQHGFAVWNNFWYAGRYSFVTYSFIYYPLAAVLGIKLLAVAVDRHRGARVRARRLAGVGAVGALLEPDVRDSLARDRPLRRVPVRARRDVRAARDRGAATRAPTQLRRPALPDAAREPARAAAARARAGRRRARADAAPRDRRRDRGGGRARACACGGSSPSRASSRSASPTCFPVSRSAFSASRSPPGCRARGGCSACSRSSSPRCSSRSSSRAISVRTSSGSSSWRSRWLCSRRRSRRSASC